MNTGQRVAMLCGWQVKAGMACLHAQYKYLDCGDQFAHKLNFSSRLYWLATEVRQFGDR